MISPVRDVLLDKHRIAAFYDKLLQSRKFIEQKFGNNGSHGCRN